MKIDVLAPREKRLQTPIVKTFGSDTAAIFYTL